MRYDLILGYVRLSDDDDNKQDESNSITNQKILIKYFLEQNEEIETTNLRFYSDDGYTGTNFNRPEFKEMMELIKNKGSYCIIVKDLSRFGRDTIETQQYIEKVLPFLGVRFISINDYYDSDDN